MIKELARAFIHQESVGDLERSRAVIYALKKKADQLYAQKIIRGYRLYVIKDKEKMDENIMVDWCDYKAVTGGEFPFGYASLQPFDENPDNFEDLMIPLGFVRCQQRIIPRSEIDFSALREIEKGK